MTTEANRGPTEARPHVETPAEFIAERRHWLRAVPVQNHRGSWDVALIVDGSYSTEAMAEGMAEHFQQRLAELLAEVA